MSKKRLQGFDLILGENTTEDSLSERSDIKNPQSIKEECKQKNSKSATKITVRIFDDILLKTKEFAYWERKTVTDVINEALNIYLKSNYTENMKKN